MTHSPQPSLLRPAPYKFLDPIGKATATETYKLKSKDVGISRYIETLCTLQILATALSFLINMAFLTANAQPLLFTLPRELRDEIYQLLALPQLVISSTTKHPNRSLRRMNASGSEAHIDTRIYLPIRAPPNLTGTCRQLREECLDTISYLTNSSMISKTKHEDPQPVREELTTFACKENTEFEEIAERALDSGTVRVTLEMARPYRTNMGAYIPKRDAPSPRFLALVPMLSRVRKVKFVVWGAYEWWKGPQQRYIRVLKSERSLVKRTSADESDSVLSKRKIDISIQAQLMESKPNPLNVAIDTILEHLPMVEEVDVDVLINPGEYWNWDLPENRWEGIQGWLDDTIISKDGKKMRRVYRRLIACESSPPARGATFYHQLETLKDDVVHVELGTGEVRRRLCWEDLEYALV